VITGP